MESSNYCKDCNTVFDESKSFDQHICIKTEKTTDTQTATSGRCDKCGKDYNNLKEHFLSHIENYDFTCDVCGKKFRTKVRLRKHCLTHISRYICPVCGKGFGMSQTLKVHMRIHNDEKPFKCDQCGKTFTQKVHLQDHNLNHSNLFEYPCDVCGKLCRTKRSLKNHRLCHHRLCYNKESVFKCPMCSNTYQHKGSLDRHVCSTHSEYVKKHQSTKPHLSSEEKPHSCDYCGARFKKFCSLKQHLTKHTGEKPYVCDICQKAFHINAHLTSHMKSHSNERPYTCKQCDICGKTLSCRSLKSHYLTHSDERPFHCGICGKNFKRMTPLQNHLITHTGELTHSCKVCGKSFARKSTLENHFILHTGEKPYLCLICSRGFSRKSSLKIHVSTVHAGEAEPKKFDNRAEHMIAGDIAKHAVLVAHNFLSEADIMQRKRPTLLRMNTFKQSPVEKTSRVCDSENTCLDANGSAGDNSIDSSENVQINDIFEVDRDVDVTVCDKADSVSCVPFDDKSNTDSTSKQRLEVTNEHLYKDDKTET